MKEMSLVEHLEELRTTVIRVAVIVLVTFVAAYGLGEHISEILLTPLRGVLGEKSQGSIVYLGLLDKVISQLQLAFGVQLFYLHLCGFMKSGALLSQVFMIMSPKWFAISNCWVFLIYFGWLFCLLCRFSSDF